MTAKKKDLLDADKALEMIKLFKELDAINLEKAAEEKRASLTPVEQLVEDLKNNKKLDRRIKGTKPVIPQWKRRANRRKYRKAYYHSKLKHDRRIDTIELLSAGAEGWWTHIREFWYRKKIPVEMTKEEFVDIVWPALGGKVPVFRRYDTRKGISLGNIYVVESGTKNTVLWDGAEYTLKQLGAIL